MKYGSELLCVIFALFLLIFVQEGGVDRSQETNVKLNAMDQAMTLILFFIASPYLNNCGSHGWAIKCWDCRSNDHPKCSDPFDNATIQYNMNCKEAACVKIIYKDGDQEITERKCVEKFKDKKFECVTTKTSDVIVECETCMTDFCNTASKVNMGLLSVVAVVVTLVAPRIRYI